MYMIKRYSQEKTIHLVIDRPDKKNALNRSMYEQLAGYVREASSDQNVHAVVISGAEGVFTAGNDLDDFRARATDENPKPSAGLAFIEELMACDTPVIAAVEGVAIGIGTTMLLHCDSVFSGRSARFKTAFVDLGLVPEAASTVTMPLHLGSRDRKSTRLNSSHVRISYAVFCLKKKIPKSVVFQSRVDDLLRAAGGPRTCGRAYNTTNSNPVVNPTTHRKCNSTVILSTPPNSK